MSRSGVSSIVDRLSKYDSTKLPPESPLKNQPKPKRNGPIKNKSEVEEITDRLSKYDNEKGPPESPEKRDNRKQEGDGENTIKLSDQEIDEIVNRLIKIPEKYGPPGSNTNRRYLGYGRYDYSLDSQQQQQSFQLEETKKVPASKMEEIIQRLQTPYGADKVRIQSGISDRKNKFVSEEELDAIISRLRQFDQQRYPPGSTSTRANLGYNRFDYGPQKRQQKGPRVISQREEEIIARLSQFDITKGPPGSRGHEKLLK